MSKLRTLLAVAALAPTLSLAAIPKAGQYTLSDTASELQRTLCVNSDGSWTSSGYGAGRWLYVESTKTTNFFGYDISGLHSVAFSIKGRSANVVQFTPQFFNTYVWTMDVAFVGKTCAANP